MTEKPTLTLTRRLAAPPVLVYRAWTDPATIVLWWGPAGATTRSAKADPRPGGRYHIVFSTPDGESHDVSGTYREAEEFSRLAFTWMWKTLPDRESFVTLTFVDDGAGGTDFTLHHSRFFDEAARDRHRWGWTGALDKLEAMFKGGQSVRSTIEDSIAEGGAFSDDEIERDLRELASELAKKPH